MPCRDSRHVIDSQGPCGAFAAGDVSSPRIHRALLHDALHDAYGGRGFWGVGLPGITSGGVSILLTLFGVLSNGILLVS